MVTNPPICFISNKTKCRWKRSGNVPQRKNTDTKIQNALENVQNQTLHRYNIINRFYLQNNVRFKAMPRPTIAETLPRFTAEPLCNRNNVQEKDDGICVFYENSR